MRTRTFFNLAPLGLVVVLASAALQLDAAKETAAPAQDNKPAHQYVGTDKCKLCHMKKTTGEQYTVWKKSKHAKAFETLGTPEAKEVAKKMGIEDPQKSEKCLRCHTTGFNGKPEEYAATYKQKEGVGCETCHGPASDWIKEEVHTKDKSAALKVGMTVPDEALCKKCHNKDSPSYKEFDFAKFSKEIAHPNPERKK